MTNRIYHRDSYQQEFEAEIIDVDPTLGGILLSKTAFYPGGGGQPPDRGHLTIGGNVIPVAGLKSISGKIIHILPSGTPLPKIGTALRGRIDWDYRYQLMRTHTAMHVLCGVIFRDYGASVTGGNMTPLQGRMDFEFASLRKEFVAVIEKSVNLEITSARPVSWQDVPREEALQIPDLIRTKINLVPSQIAMIRVVEIEGLDLQADGGTHVRNTSEIGQVYIADYKSKGKDNKRIYLQLDS